jgi:hypothetical protein
VKSRILGVFLTLAATAAATAGLASVGPVSTASATTCTYHLDWMIDREYIDGWGRFNPCGGRPTNSVAGWPGVAGHVACVGAYDIATSTWAGTSVCANGDVSHPYNSTNRLGWGGVPYGHVAEVNTTVVWW